LKSLLFFCISATSTVHFWNCNLPSSYTWVPHNFCPYCILWRYPFDVLTTLGDSARVQAMPEGNLTYTPILVWDSISTSLAWVSLVKAKVIALHYIALHSLDLKLVRMTVGCGICYINTKTYVQYSWSFHTRKPKKTQWLHMRLLKNTSTYIHHYCQLMLFRQPLNGLLRSLSLLIPFTNYRWCRKCYFLEGSSFHN
jgi:hypothetical protein